MTRLASFLLLVLALLSSTASAQEPSSVGPGARVRVWTSPTAEPLTGKVLKLDATTMTLSVEDVDHPITVTRHSIARMDVSGGRHATRKSVLLGALIGASIGFVAGLGSGDDDPHQFFNNTAAEKAAFFPILTAPIGIIVGAIAGQERWATTTPTSAKLSQTIAAPTPSLRLSFRF